MAHYSTFQFQLPVPSTTGALTIDTYSNTYFTFSGNLGTANILPPLRLAGGQLVANQEAATGKLGVEWKPQSGVPNETRLESFLTEWSLSVGGGFGVGQDFILTLSSTDPARFGVERGIYTPQFGIALNFTWLLYDADSDTPWIWQR